MKLLFKRFVVIGVCIVASVFLLLKFNQQEKKSANGIHQLEKREEAADPPKKQIEFDDIFNGVFRYKTFYPAWISGKEYIQRKSTGEFVIVDIESEIETTFMSKDAWSSYTNPYDWSVSEDLEYMAITYDYTDGYAHYVRTFSVDIWNVTTGQKVDVKGFTGKNIQKFKWSSVGQDFAYVYGFNVYVIQDFSASPYAVTSDGDEQLMFNGISDWLFSIEITDDDALLWWSPDGKYLAFATINQTGVKQFEMTVFNSNQYPEIVKFPYPKPGTTIPKTTLTVFNLTSMDINVLIPNVDPSWGDKYYLNSAVWRGSTFTPTWKNRIENHAITENCPAPDFICAHGSAMEEKSMSGWVGHYKPHDIYPVTDSNEYITVHSFNGYPHVAVHNIADDDKDMRTEGMFEVTDYSSGYASIHHYDDINDWIYFTSTEIQDKNSQTGQGLPRIRHLWRVKGHGNEKTRICISCQLNFDFPNRCNWVNPSFSRDGSYVVVNCGGTANGVPISTLHNISSTGDIEFVRVVENNSDLQNTLNEYDFRTTEFDSLELPGVSGEWYYMLLKPPNFDPKKKYPLLVQVYSGPAYQEVEDRFSVSWKDYVASSKEVVVMSFDGRGTGYRGDEILHMVYKKLGQFEPLDQIEAARIIGQNNFIDEDKTAIWGWSYGGYATTRTIGEDKDGVFKCGFAVAPVTRWELYHTIYTERYMTLPENNQDGYSKSTTLQKMENFKKHRYIILHGTRDENVHFLNSAQLSKYLIRNDVDFRAYFAADDDHGMNRVKNNYRTIYKMITYQMDICFGFERAL